MYRLGASSSMPYFEANHEARNSFLSPRSDSVRRSSMADDILGGSIYDPSYYSSLFEEVRSNACNHQVLPSNFCHSALSVIVSIILSYLGRLPLTLVTNKLRT